MDNKSDYWKIRSAGRKGSGLFATRAFSKRERVYSFPKGRIVTHEKLDTLSAEEKLHVDQIGEDQFEVMEPPACFVNHSCEPNIEERERVGYALRDILDGEELTIDYDTVGSLEEPFECWCGSGQCRGIVRGDQRS